MNDELFIVGRELLSLPSFNIDDYPNGIVIPIDKPYKWTSADVVRRVKFLSQRLFKKKNIKVGHAGTLDPLATGVLLVCLGRATKRAEQLQSQQKEYIASVELGATTPCFDMEKEIDNYYEYKHITKDSLQSALSGFLGEQQQVPPLFSAKLIDGKRAYELARAGDNVEMKPSLITIYNIDLLEFNLPRVVVKIACSKGTYIRSFARDLGVALNSGGYLSGLIRSASGEFKVENCLKIEEVENLLKHF